MNNQEKIALAKNALVNVARGGAAAFIAMLLPPFLTRLMSSDSYGAWSLVLQISAFVGYLDFGLQTAIGRFFAQARENRETQHRDQIVNTSVTLLVAAGVVGAIGCATLAYLMPRIFHQIPSSLLRDARLSLIFVGVSLAVGLPASVFNGIFVGLQRYEIPAVVIGCSRLLSAVLVIAIAKYGGNLAMMGVVVAAINVMSYVLQYVLYRKFAPRVRFSWGFVSRNTAHELFDYCMSLSIWSFAMLLVSGLDVSLVGYFEFDKVAYYSVAATLVLFVAGLQNALFHVLIPSTAILQARGNSGELGSMMITSTRYGSFVLLLVGLPLMLAAKKVLTVWVGPAYAVEGARILQVLTVANMIRLSSVPYVMTLVGTGQQRLVTVTPILEGVTNLLVSVVAGSFFGALGIAIGTLVGGFVGVMGNLVYNMPRTVDFKFKIADYVRDGLFRPLICALPLLLVVFSFRIMEIPLLSLGYMSVGAAIVATCLLVWYFGLAESEREKLRSYCIAIETR